MMKLITEAGNKRTSIDYSTAAAKQALDDWEKLQLRLPALSTSEMAFLEVTVDAACEEYLAKEGGRA